MTLPGSAPPPPTKQQPANSTDENPYLGKFYQIRPAANDTMCLSAFVSWDNTIDEADSINLYVSLLQVSVPPPLPPRPLIV